MKKQGKQSKDMFFPKSTKPKIHSKDPVPELWNFSIHRKLTRSLFKNNLVCKGARNKRSIESCLKMNEKRVCFE